MPDNANTIVQEIKEDAQNFNKMGDFSNQENTRIISFVAGGRDMIKILVSRGLLKEDPTAGDQDEWYR